MIVGCNDSSDTFPWVSEQHDKCGVLSEGLRFVMDFTLFFFFLMSALRGSFSLEDSLKSYVCYVSLALHFIVRTKERLNTCKENHP